MIAMALATVAALGLSTVLVNHTTQLQHTRIIASRDELFSKLARTSADPRALALSASFAGNTAFANCVNGSVGGCVVTPRQPFSLIDALGVQLTTGLYNTLGSPCTVVNSNCFTEALTTFTATCPGASPCDRANSVTVEYTVRQSPAFTAYLLLGTRVDTVVNMVPLQATATGTIGRIPKWTTSTTLSDSNMTEDTFGKVGIGTASPSEMLDVGGTSTGAVRIGGRGAFALAAEAACLASGPGDRFLVWSPGTAQTCAQACGAITCGATAGCVMGWSVWPGTAHYRYGSECTVNDSSGGQGITGKFCCCTGTGCAQNMYR